jgi:hypothetical protein
LFQLFVIFSKDFYINDVNVVHVDNDHDVIYKSKWKNKNANVLFENLNDENLHYLVEKVENLDVDNIDMNITQNRIKLSNIEV